ncbi:cytochrome c [Sulfuriferula plumbiphila]|uniref:Cytochrome c n=1 Tax=Sulfuriferula plumbiphila TaxID=171865 RepID=A0A512LB91_9PROT|nr:cytochrome c1 [Sulfuriferula plumbiphila]BBP04342.1 cytochrome c [Sulfuriferula plumbiphila]GEP31726.1 cytochrome c [Sulfuriferula plumbiphila]
MKKFLLALLFAPLIAFGSEGNVHLDKAPVNLEDYASLQRGARIFTNYCLSCHSAAAMRYSRLEDIGLSKDQIKDNLMFASDNVGDTMTISMSPDNAKAWFGAAPPDLSVEARARTPDWLYTYLRSFYLDDSRPTGWNNTVFEKVGMPHVLYTLQGEQVLKKSAAGAHDEQARPEFELVKPGKLSPAEYNAMVGDLVNYLTWMAEPAKATRQELGIVVLLFLGVFFVLAYYLKKEFWKDIH